MNTVSEKLHKWSIQELNLVSEGDLNKIPDVESFRCLTKGKNKRIWTYVLNHVRSQSMVDKIKRALAFKKVFNETEGNILFFNDGGWDVVEAQTAVSKATERRMFLMRTLSTIEERIISLEQKIRKTNDETFQINQKAAFLELLKQKYNDKNLALKIILSHISSHVDSLQAYQSPNKLCHQSNMSLPYGFLYEKLNNDAVSIVKDLLNTISAVIKVKFIHEGENGEMLLENLTNRNYELKKKDFLLTELVVLLKGMSDSDVQEFTTSSSQNASAKKMSKYQKNPARKLLTQMKYDNVHYALSAVKNKKKISHFVDVKNKIIVENTTSLRDKEDIDFETKFTLLEKLAENEALKISNNYLEETLTIISNKTESLLQSFDDVSHSELSFLVQRFYKDADLTFYLLGSASDAFQKILDDLNNLQSFSRHDLFESQLSFNKNLKDMTTCFASDRKLMWKYCEKANLIEPFYSGPYKMSFPLSTEVRKLIQPFENVGSICGKLSSFKIELQTDVMAYGQECVEDNQVKTTEIYQRIIKMLEKMKFSIEKGMLFTNEGILCYNKTKTLIQEWWEQKAQFIPHIEYEGKTLKMWLDILSVLSDFEPRDY